MVQTLKRDDLKTLLYEKKKHDTGDVFPILPFLSKRTRAIRQFNKVLGEFIRSISGVEFNEKALGNKDFYLSKEENDLSEYIASQVEFSNEDDESDFVRFLNEYLFNQEEIKPIHPYLFNYIKLDKNLKNEFGKYAQFMNETLIKNHPDIKKIFSNKDSDDILTELILEKMTTLEKMKNSSETQKQYQSLLGAFTELYQEDIIYLSKYKDYFLASFPLLTHYYVFMYVCQLLLKFEQFTEADYQKVQPLYFALDWEAISKRRKAADDLEGFSYLKEKLVHLFPHIHTISHLSHNSFNEMRINEVNNIQFIPYADLYAEIQSKGAQYEEAFLNDLKQWIKEYCVWAKIEITDDSTTIPDAFKVLFTCLREGMSTGVCVKYGQNLEDLGSSQFLKTRGSLGQVLNIKHEFLLLLTAVSVKDQRIPLNDLFVEFEKRGVAFDRYSKKEIITLFDNLNIIDKKSDSGDAQYVKPIL
ncbi:DNA phosphorothioation-dependent restriction protein DptG [Neobacillus rhizosphaerae]|uniref:DNA phosphorothioation-dependent restriction protein DptG n=1 Tax=Neobacillus rhizosphaerae TaxID=2880965 RepID=UPI003D2DAF9E